MGVSANMWQGAPPTSAELQTAINYQMNQKVERLFKDAPDLLAEFQEVYACRLERGSGVKEIDLDTAMRVTPEVVHFALLDITNHDDKEKYTPEGPMSLDAMGALDYLDTIKERFRVNRPDVYSEFLNIMKDFKSEIDASEVIDRVSSFFRGHAD
ncbi:hypothetical protein ACEPAH_1249 [Sanghuangporus vaninii]